MDYKQKYLKYKNKYFGLKDTHSDLMIEKLNGGDGRFDNREKNYNLFGGYRLNKENKKRYLELLKKLTISTEDSIRQIDEDPFEDPLSQDNISAIESEPLNTDITEKIRQSNILKSLLLFIGATLDNVVGEYEKYYLEFIKIFIYEGIIDQKKREFNKLKSTSLKIIKNFMEYYIKKEVINLTIYNTLCLLCSTFYTMMSLLYGNLFLNQLGEMEIFEFFKNFLMDESNDVYYDHDIFSDRDPRAQSNEPIPNPNSIQKIIIYMKHNYYLSKLIHDSIIKDDEKFYMFVYIDLFSLADICKSYSKQQYFIGITTDMIMADGLLYSPFEFSLHDINHCMAREINLLRLEDSQMLLNYEKQFITWLTKQKIDKENLYKIYLTLFIIMHENSVENFLIKKIDVTGVNYYKTNHNELCRPVIANLSVWVEGPLRDLIPKKTRDTLPQFYSGKLYIIQKYRVDAFELFKEKWNEFVDTVMIIESTK
jgi:hypothetical protein